MRDLWSGIIFFGLSLVVLWESLRAGFGTSQKPGSGFISFWAGVILATLSLMLVYQSRGMREAPRPHSRRVILALVSLFVYSLALEPLGFILSTFFLMAVFFRLAEKRNWWTLLGMSALVTFLMYLVFGILLQVYFPEGLLRL